jgi:hypothetical protein
MPADQALVIALGTGGINLRDQPSQLGQGELTDSLNWQLDQNRALVKRLGYQEWADALPADALEVFSYEPSGGTIKQLAHAANGHVYWTTDGIAWTSIDSGLSISQPAIFIQYLDKVYWCDGVGAWRQWDGAVLTLLPTTDVNDVQTVSLTGVPTGGTFKLGLNGELSANLNWNATAADLQTALQGLTGIGPGNVLCTGGPLPGTPIVCTFVAGEGLPARGDAHLNQRSHRWHRSRRRRHAHDARARARTAGADRRDLAKPALARRRPPRLLVEGGGSDGLHHQDQLR